MNDALDLSKGLPSTIFLAGVYMATFAACGLFFFKFWKKTKEKFFLYFGLGCWILSIERVPFLWLSPTEEANPWFYVLRLFAFVLIMRAVIRANFAKSKQD